MLNLFWQVFLTLLSKVLELLEGAENGRYKVVAKAEPYKNLPVSLRSPSSYWYVIIAFHFPKLDNARHLFVQPAPVTPEYEVTPPGDSFYDWGGRSVHFVVCSAGEFKCVCIFINMYWLDYVSKNIVNKLI